jgi:hypothetical protein
MSEPITENQGLAPEKVELLSKPLDEILEEIKAMHDGWGDDGYDPDRCDALLWVICYRVASVMSEEHCCLIEQAARAIAYYRQNHPDACPEWKKWGAEMQRRTLKAIYE